MGRLERYSQTWYLKFLCDVKVDSNELPPDTVRWKNNVTGLTVVAPKTDSAVCDNLYVEGIPTRDIPTPDDRSGRTIEYYDVSRYLNGYTFCSTSPTRVLFSMTVVDPTYDDIGVWECVVKPIDLFQETVVVAAPVHPESSRHTPLGEAVMKMKFPQRTITMDQLPIENRLPAYEDEHAISVTCELEGFSRYDSYIKTMSPHEGIYETRMVVEEDDLMTGVLKEKSYIRGELFGKTYVPRIGDLDLNKDYKNADTVCFNHRWYEHRAQTACMFGYDRYNAEGSKAQQLFAGDQYCTDYDVVSTVTNHGKLNGAHKEALVFQYNLLRYTFEPPKQCNGFSDDCAGTTYRVAIFTPNTSRLYIETMGDVYYEPIYVGAYRLSFYGNLGIEFKKHITFYPSEEAMKGFYIEFALLAAKWKTIEARSLSGRASFSYNVEMVCGDVGGEEYEVLYMATDSCTTDTSYQGDVCDETDNPYKARTFKVEAGGGAKVIHSMPNKLNVAQKGMPCMANVYYCFSKKRTVALTEVNIVEDRMKRAAPKPVSRDVGYACPIKHNTAQTVDPYTKTYATSNANWLMMSTEVVRNVATALSGIHAGRAPLTLSAAEFYDEDITCRCQSVLDMCTESLGEFKIKYKELYKIHNENGDRKVWCESMGYRSKKYTTAELVINYACNEELMTGKVAQAMTYQDKYNAVLQIGSLIPPPKIAVYKAVGEGWEGAYRIQVDKLYHACVYDNTTLASVVIKTERGDEGAHKYVTNVYYFNYIRPKSIVLIKKTLSPEGDTEEVLPIENRVSLKWNSDGTTTLSLYVDLNANKTVYMGVGSTLGIKSSSVDDVKSAIENAPISCEKDDYLVETYKGDVGGESVYITSKLTWTKGCPKPELGLMLKAPNQMDVIKSVKCLKTGNAVISGRGLVKYDGAEDTFSHKDYTNDEGSYCMWDPKEPEVVEAVIVFRDGLGIFEELYAETFVESTAIDEVKNRTKVENITEACMPTPIHFSPSTVYKYEEPTKTTIECGLPHVLTNVCPFDYNDTHHNAGERHSHPVVYNLWVVVSKIVGESRHMIKAEYNPVDDVCITDEAKVDCSVDKNTSVVSYRIQDSYFLFLRSIDRDTATVRAVCTTGSKILDTSDSVSMSEVVKRVLLDFEQKNGNVGTPRVPDPPLKEGEEEKKQIVYIAVGVVASVILFAVVTMFVTCCTPRKIKRVVEQDAEMAMLPKLYR